MPPTVDASAPFPAPILEIDDARRQAIERARSGELLAPADMQLVFRLSRTRFFELQRAGTFDAFKAKIPIGLKRYSGFLVYEDLMGRDPAAPARVFAGSRRR